MTMAGVRRHGYQPAGLEETDLCRCREMGTAARVLGSPRPHDRQGSKDSADTPSWFWFQGRTCTPIVQAACHMTGWVRRATDHAECC